MISALKKCWLPHRNPRKICGKSAKKSRNSFGFEVCRVFFFLLGCCYFSSESSKPMFIVLNAKQIQELVYIQLNILYCPAQLKLALQSCIANLSRKLFNWCFPLAKKVLIEIKYVSFSIWIEIIHTFVFNITWQIFSKDSVVSLVNGSEEASTNLGWNRPPNFNR